MHDLTYIYFLCSRPEADATFVKVGVAVDPRKRIATVLCGCPLEVASVSTVAVRTRKMALLLERELHSMLSRWSARGEWFRVIASELGEFRSHSAAALDMVLGKGSWSMVDIDWEAHEFQKKSKVAALVTSGKLGRLNVRRRRAGEMAKFRRGG
jgi:hypothetical protein